MSSGNEISNNVNGRAWRVAAMTLGCKVNFYDTEAMLKLFSESGYEIVNFSDTADVYIINTCTVTNLSDSKSRQMVGRARKKTPGAVIAAVGCYAQVAPEEVSDILGVNIVIGTKDRSLIVSRVEEYRARKAADSEVIKDEAKNFAPKAIFVGDIMKERKFENLKIDSQKSRQRAFLKIQEGCDRFCTYCIIPYARGPVRSRLPDEVLDEAKRLAEAGYKEIVLAGIHVASYGKDLEDADLLKVLAAVTKIAGIERIRLSSIEPTVVTPEFLRVIKELPKVCDHFHLSLQSGSDNTLKRMNRRYTAEQYKKAAYAIREAMPDAALTTDIIAGFPGETDFDFTESFEFIRAVGLSKLHVFPYSPKKGTPSAGYENQISDAVKNGRAKNLLELSDRLEAEFLRKAVGKTYEVLVEGHKDGICEGLTTNYINVKFLGGKNLINDIVSVKIEKAEKAEAFGVVCAK